MNQARTKQGSERKAWCKPPSDVWRILRMLEEAIGMQLPAVGAEGHWLWTLLKAVYGLDDAPLLWREKFIRVLVELASYVVSRNDPCLLLSTAGR